MLGLNSSHGIKSHNVNTVTDVWDCMQILCMYLHPMYVQCMQDCNNYYYYATEFCVCSIKAVFDFSSPLKVHVADKQY